MLPSGPSLARTRRGRGLLLLASERPGGRVLASPNTNPRQPLSAAAALGRTGKPQFITKMENDTSPRSSPGEGLIYDRAGAGDIRQRRLVRTPSAGALIAVLLATSVKDALRIGYLLLFIIKARQPGSRVRGVVSSLEPALRPCPAGLPSPIPTYHPSLVRIRLPSPRRDQGVIPGAEAKPEEGQQQACTPSAPSWALPLLSLAPSHGRRAKTNLLGCGARQRLVGAGSSVTLGMSLPLPERAPLCTVGTRAPQGCDQLKGRGVCAALCQLLLPMGLTPEG